MKRLLWLGLIGLLAVTALPRPAQAQSIDGSAQVPGAKKHKRHHRHRHNHHKGHVTQDRYPQQ
jgi:hypothetical protein